VVVTKTRITADEYLAIGVDPWGRRSQLIDGEIVMNEPTRWHQDAVKEIVLALGAWERQ
jgi:Uma2 family endonuclease